MAEQLNQIPSSLEPIAELKLGEKTLVVSVTAVWYKFFVSMSAVLGNLIGGVLGFTSSNDVTATGTVQANAVALTTEWSVITTTPVNSGVMVAAFGAGVPNTVFNRGANTLKVYPPVGAQIDALGINAPYPLATNKMQTFYQTDTAEFLSTQLG